MKVWKIETIIETENSWKKDRLLKYLDRVVNHGDGAYMDISNKTMKLKMVKKDDL